MKPTDVIRRPLTTEKTTIARETTTVIVFEVATGATKIDVKRAVEKLFGAKVASVRTVQYDGKIKKRGRQEGRRPSWKKAYVTLRKGEPMVDYAEAI